MKQSYWSYPGRAIWLAVILHHFPRHNINIDRIILHVAICFSSCPPFHFKMVVLGAILIVGLIQVSSRRCFISGIDVTFGESCNYERMHILIDFCYTTLLYVNDKEYRTFLCVYIEHANKLLINLFWCTISSFEFQGYVSQDVNQFDCEYEFERLNCSEQHDNAQGNIHKSSLSLHLFINIYFTIMFI